MRTSERLSGDARSPGRTRALLRAGGSRIGPFLQHFSWLRTPEPAAEPYVPGETRLARELFWPALTGAIGSLLVLWGASQPTSPFTLNHNTLQTLSDSAQILLHDVRLWYFGAGAVRGHELVGVVAVYVGMFLMIRAWVAVARLTRRHPGTPIRRLVPVFVVWLLPLLVVAPLFSHDVFSYVGQGEQVSRGINPYLYPPYDLGQGANQFASLVDSLWARATSPYGPVFLGTAGQILSLVNHNELAAVLGFRVLAVFGVVLVAIFTPRLARSYGRDGAQAFVLVALNPLILFHLVAGEHNDALMMGLLVAGLSLARERHRLSGVVLCTLAGLVKAPALIGVVYVGWDWAGVGLPWRARLRPTAKALAVSGATMVAVTYAVGLGWGWVLAVKNQGTVTSWMDPATGIGELITRLVNAVGLGEHASIINIVHGIGLAAAAVIAVSLLLRSDGGVSSLRAMGLTLLAVVVLGPVIQPWYFVWGIIVLVPIAQGRTRSGLIVLSAVMSYLGLPGGKELLSYLGRAGPLVLLAAVAVLVAVAVLSFAPRFYEVAKLRRQEAGRVAELTVPSADS
jgi:hypothetical protein